jgi:hypothetical protein
MSDEITMITKDLEYTIKYFYPVLDELRKNQGNPIFLSSFNNLKNIDNINNWVITILKTNLYNSKATQLIKYNKKHGIFNFYIILDKTLFIKTKKMKEIKNIIIVHEFIHFLALLFASINVKDNEYYQKLIERYSHTSDTISNENLFKLYQLLNKSNLFDNFYTYTKANDAHFRLGFEEMYLDYAELFRNFLFSRQILETYFTTEKRNTLFKLIKNKEIKKAEILLNELMHIISKEENLQIDFVYNQTSDFIMKYYSDEYMDN